MRGSITEFPPQPPLNHGYSPPTQPHIVFASTYPPVVCGVGTYVSYLARAMSPGRASVVAFHPERYGGRVALGYVEGQGVPVSFVLPRPTTDSSTLAAAVSAATPAPLDRTVLWFQHAPDIWPKFAELLRGLIDFPARKVASLHVVHFQSSETPWGLLRCEHQMLSEVLPMLDRATVFTPAAREAVCSAFPEYAEKVTVLRHGMHTPRLLGRDAARQRLRDYLAGIPESVRPQGAASALIEALADPSCAFVGTLGFIQWGKGYEAAYALRDSLQARLPERRVIGLVIGAMREPQDRRNRRLLSRLAEAADGSGTFLVTALPPDPIFQASLRAMDLNLYWPDAPTQSGRVSHALGVGGTTIGRDIEGVGETLREAGAPTCTEFDELVHRAVDLLRNPLLAHSIRARGRRYALSHSWAEQAQRHLELADALAARRDLVVSVGHN
jgi:glycosyltransferase involved in cell wall biosynthesis